ncbi:MAG: D-glycerate dehydrogenase [Ignavibacteria bacterium]|nr:D-glycerate dehydrogenase [Ignavibacteria bacterium]
MLPPVFLTREIPEEGMRILRERTSLTMFPHDRLIAKTELVDAVREAEGLLAMLTDPVDADVISAAPKLKVIANCAVGYNNIDLDAARARGIVVTNTPGVLTDATADIAFALLISCARRIVESDRWLRARDFDGWAPMLFRGLDLAGRTVGIIGGGRIGQAMARRCALGFGMRVIYRSRNRNEEMEHACNAHAADLDTLLRESDFVSLHVPLTPETRHMIGARELALMNPSAVLVNTARGPVVDEQALIAALREHRIFAAGLDVYEFEPAIPGELKALDNVVILPHIGSASFETRARMAVMAAENVVAVLEGREAMNRVG